MVKVIAWPPVGRLSHDWTEEAPTATSRSIVTGKRYVSAAQAKRRLCALTVSSRARGGAGAGYMEALKRLLAGREHLVRLTSLPIPDARDAAVISGLLGATAGTSGGWPILTVTGLPPNALVARPGTFATYYSPVGAAVGETVMVVADATSNAGGTAVLRLLTAVAGTGRVEINTRDNGVFEAVSIPRSPQPVSGDWQWAWDFREVFEAETDGFVEVNPWSP